MEIAEVDAGKLFRAGTQRPAALPVRSDRELEARCVRQHREALALVQIEHVKLGRVRAFEDLEVREGVTRDALDRADRDFDLVRIDAAKRRPAGGTERP